MKYMKHLIFAFVFAMVAVGAVMGTDVRVLAEDENTPITSDGFEYEINEEENTVTIINYSGNGGDVVIPSEIEGKPVTSIGNRAFSAPDLQLLYITIPDSVISIGDRAFEGCQNLRNVTIPDSVTSIGESAFWGCFSLTDITLSNSITCIEESTFSYCNPENITIPDSVISIGMSAFQGCQNLRNVTIPDSVTSIGASAFEHCTHLTDITIPDSVTSINSGAFSNCVGLTNVTLSDSVTSIGMSAFMRCRLESITIPGSVANIEAYAFEDCTHLTDITLLDGVTDIGESAFMNCNNLKNISIPDSVTSIGVSAFKRCNNLKNISIPNSVTSIGASAFEDCDNLTSITIPDNVSRIEDHTFYNCFKLSSVIIPNTVTYIARDVFRCSDYTPDINIYYTGTQADWEEIDSARFDDGATVTIHYNSTFPEHLTLNVSKLTLSIDDTYSITATITPADVTAKDVNYFSSDPYIVFCSNDGTITANSSGTAIITAMTVNGLTAQVNIDVIAGTVHSCNTQGHIEISDAGFPATCTKNGLTDGIHCLICGEILVGQEEIPAMGHQWGNWSTILLPTTTSEGERMRTCTVCNFSETQKTSSISSESPSAPSSTAPSQTPPTSLPAVTSEVPPAPTVIVPPSGVQNLTAKNKKKKAVTLSWKKTADANGYEIQYAANKKFTKQKKSKVVTSTKVTIKKLKKNKTYYFRVRAYRWNGTVKVYGKWSVVKKVMIKK